MKTSEQIKGAIRNISKKTGVNPNSLLQMCLFEGVLEKLSKSKYSKNFILKGGLLISSLIGIDMRSTMDMDTTIKGIPLNQKTISKIVKEILEIKIDADIDYKLVKLTPIRQKDVYEDFCAKISCTFGKINAVLNIDITTGDVITPREMRYFYSKILESGTIPIMTYTIESIIAEKFETISSRNITTTRARDFYDLYMLYHLYKDKIDKDILREAIERTSEHRGSIKSVSQYKEVVDLFKISGTTKTLWEKYIKSNPYAKDIDLQHIGFPLDWDEYPPTGIPKHQQQIYLSDIKNKGKDTTYLFYQFANYLDRGIFQFAYIKNKGIVAGTYEDYFFPKGEVTFLKNKVKLKHLPENELLWAEELKKEWAEKEKSKK